MKFGHPKIYKIIVSWFELLKYITVIFCYVHYIFCVLLHYIIVLLIWFFVIIAMVHLLTIIKVTKSAHEVFVSQIL